MVNSNTAAHETVSTSRGYLRTVAGLEKRHFYALIFSLLFANSILPQMIIHQSKWGIAASVSQTYGISIVVWAALFLGCQNIFNARDSEYRLSEKFLFVVMISAIIVPSGAFSSILQAAVAMFVIWAHRDDGAMRKAGWIFLAATLPIYFTKKVMTFFGQYIVLFDAYLVSLMTKTSQAGNLVVMPGGEGALLIAPGCSSLSNVSSAMLCWVLFTQTRNVRWSRLNVVWCAAACASVVTINVARISAIGYFPDYYYLLHDGFGALVANWMSSIAAVTVCHLGTRHAQ